MAKLEGKVTNVSESGTAVTDISLDQLTDVPTDDSVSITCEGHTTVRIFPEDHGQPEMTFIAARGKSGYLEISLVGDSVSTFLGIGPGSSVVVKW